MTRYRNLLRSIVFVCVSTVVAQLPYNPTHLVTSSTGRYVYDISAGSRLIVTVFEVKRGWNPSQDSQSYFTILPSEATNLTYTAAASGDGIIMLVGNCQDEQTAAQVWTFMPGGEDGHGEWKQLDFTTTDESLSANYLAAGFSFSPTGGHNDTELYAFGGMCPHTDATTNEWVSNADYSNSMVAISIEDQKYQSSVKSSPPVAEAGLAITPLLPLSPAPSSGKVSQTQSFVLIGGHTQTAFINTSQIAVYSLPAAAWTFVAVTEPPTTQGDLVRRDGVSIEPRSGHTAVLSGDGTQIIVFGGWVGQTSNPASPQLVILTVGESYDSTSQWSWSIPEQFSNPFVSSEGIYGHGATMLPGDVMMISGGIKIKHGLTARASSEYLFFNVTSSTWIPSYTSPSQGDRSSPAVSSSGRSAAEQAGLGAGLGVGLAVVLAALVAWSIWARRRKQKRMEGERRLRAMALGSERFQSQSFSANRGSQFGVRSASWGSAQEKQMEGIGIAQPWPLTLPQRQGTRAHEFDFGLDVSQDGVDRSEPDPLGSSSTRGLQRSLHSGGPTGFGSRFGAVAPAGSVFRIDEEEESRNSPQARSPALSRHSNPFKDPPKIEVQSEAAAERRKEIQTWVEDWQSAAESMNLSRNPSHVRTYSNLSQAYSSSHSSSDRGRLSPDKSDRTNSNLSERSAFSSRSLQKPTDDTLTRTMSQRSLSAGYALFAGAAAAMGKFAGASKEGQLDRSPSKRSVSLNNAPSRHGRPISGESRQGLLRVESPTKSEFDVYRTPPESPIKEYRNYDRTSSLTSQGKAKARIVLGSVRRVLTGTSQVNVEGAVEHFEEVEKEAQGDPSAEPEIIEIISHPPAVPFWQGKKGARDWEHDEQYLAPESLTIRRRSGGRQTGDFDVNNYEGEEWDVETAVQKRVVQVMFTVPKERLRVVNADTLSLLSRSDTGEREEDGDADVKRMSSLKEGDEGMKPEGKGKEPVR